MASGKECPSCGKPKDPAELASNGGICDDCDFNKRTDKLIADVKKAPPKPREPEDN